MTLFGIRRDAQRVPEQFSEAEKAMRLQSVLRRRQQQIDKAALLAILYGVRSNR